MIRIACTNCKTVLSIDDAFAGGVCRCQHCGTIQTVPAAAKDPSGVQVAGQAMGGSKAIFRDGRSEGATSGTGLDDLAGIVASSGLVGSGLASRRLSSPEAGPAKSKLPMMIGIGVVALLLIAGGIFFATRGGNNTSANPTPNTPTNSQTTDVTPAVAGKPSFCGISLDGNTIVYIIDRGSGSKEIFPALKDAVLKSAGSLGADRRFQIVFWNNGSDAAYPESSATYATKENIAAAQRSIDDVSAFGSSEISSAFKKAMLRNPDTIVIATPKGWDLDDAWVDELMKLRSASTAKIHTVNLGGGGASAPLKSLSSKTGGEYKDVSDSELRTYAGD